MSDEPKSPAANIDELFWQAIELESTEQREQFLERLDQQSPELRARLERLLVAHFSSASVLDSPQHLPDAMPATVDLEATVQVGTKIGPYKLLEEIGRGGMGVVYMAEQTEPVRRKVALKIVIPGLDSAQVLARFEAERQALALMDHPNIARVLDAGTTPQGRPYFVMELVKGIAISKYCDQQRLDLRQRLGLFVPICQAIQHAHQKGIIHRDIKPSNVLVARFDGKPVPKIIDFGVAKAIGQQLTERTLFTGFGSVIGTLEYMSPEQAEFNALDVDTRSDVYSLGVLLYELLTGVTPITAEQMKRAGLIEALRVIREQEPQPPSTRLSKSDALASVSASRRTEPQLLMRSLRGELDWIVMRALEKDRNRRYESATALASDIGRYLADEPVEACPPSTMYLIRKAIRRHRTAIATAALFAVLLIAATVVSLRLAAAARHESYRAQVAADTAERARLDAERDRQRARDAEQRAEQAAAEATQHAGRAEANAADLQRQIYAADMIRIENAFKRGDMVTVREYLQRHVPQSGESDPRGFEWFYYHHRLNRDALTVSQESTVVHSICFHHEGSELLAGSYGKVDVLDSTSGRHLRTLVELDGDVSNVEVSPSGKLLAIATDDGVLTIARLADGAIVQKIRAHTEEQHAGIRAIAFGSTDDHIVTGGWHGQVKFWQVSTGTEWRAPLDIPVSISGIDWSPDETSIVVGCGGDKVQLWTLDQETPAQELHDSDWQVTQVAFHPKDNSFAAAVGKTIKIWDASSGRELKSVNCLEPVTDFQFSPDGAVIATHDGYRAIDLWDSQDGRHLNRFEGHSINIHAIAFTPDGQRLASCSGLRYPDYITDSCIKLWDVKTPPEPISVLGCSFCAKFSPDSRLLGTFGVDGTPQMFDVATGEPSYSLERANEPVQAYAIAFDPKNRLVASGAESLTISLRSNGKAIKHLTPDVGWLRKLEFSPDGDWLAVSGWRGMCVYALSSEEKIAELSIDASVWATAFSPDMRWFAAASHDSVVVWDLATKQIAKKLQISADVAQAVEFQPDSEKLAVGCSDGTILQWSTGDWRLLATWKGHRASVTDLAYNSDGSRLLSGGMDGTAIVWDVTSGGPVMTLEGQHAMVVAVDFSDDDQHIATTGYDATVKIWNAPRFPAERHTLQ